jgi:hypothetical protein
MEVVITSIDEEFRKAERMLRPIGATGHKAYTRVRRGKLESVKQSGDISDKKPAPKKPFGDYIQQLVTAVRSNIIKEWTSDLKSIGIVDLEFKDNRPYAGTDMYGITITGKYNGKPVSIEPSHQGNTMYFKFMSKEGSAMSADMIKVKMNLMLKNK